MNLSAPSLLRANQQAVIYEVAGCITNKIEQDNITVICSPMFSNTKGMAFRAESVVNEKLATANLNIDKAWTLIMEYCNARDERPHMYLGRFGLTTVKKANESKWKNSELISKLPCVGPVKALKTSEML